MAGKSQASVKPQLAEERWLTPDQVREKLQISKSKFYVEILGGLPHIRIGKTIRVPESKLETWLQSKRA
jgi:excisionase family DNA binding protein